MRLKYFGTDGIRGLAGQTPLSLPEVARWGAAWTQVARERGIERFFMGWDPRRSSEPFARAFLRGVGGRMDVVLLGMVPTAAVAWPLPRTERSWGIVFTASHNPPEDNGIKGFGSDGVKLEEADEAAIERAFEIQGEVQTPESHLKVDPLWSQRYSDHLPRVAWPQGFRLVVDCAHGATARMALELFQGAEADWLGRPEDGDLINMGVGATHLEGLKERVRLRKADVGLAFDGDGDRCLFVDPEGEVVDGDQLLWLLVQDRMAQGDPPAGVLGTLMTNGGLESALEELGIPFFRTPVGDKYLVREIQSRGWDLAAEASGHLIQWRLGTTGDGLATAMTALSSLLARPKADRWNWRFEPWPHRIVNIVALERKALEAMPLLQGAIQSLEARHGRDLRLVVRWSGTEPKLRIMGEARRSEVLEEALLFLEASACEDLGILKQTSPC